MAQGTNLVDVVSTLKTLSTQPESYFQPNKNLQKDTLDSLKVLFDFSRQKDPSKENNSCPLTELMVEGFDDEQIWQQIELQNTPVVSDIRRQLKQLNDSSYSLQLLCQSTEKNGFDDDDSANDIEFDDSDDNFDDDDDENIKGRSLIPASSSDDDDNDNDAEKQDDVSDFENDSFTKEEMPKTKDFTKTQESNKQKEKQKFKTKGSIVDDQFFKLSEMTEFLDKMDQQFERNQDRKKTKEGDDDEDNDVDFFRDISSDDDDGGGDDDWGNVLGNTAKIMGRDIKDSKHKAATDLKYSDYFDPPHGENRQKSNKDIDTDDDDTDNDDGGGDEDFGSDDDANDKGMEEDDYGDEDSENENEMEEESKKEDSEEEGISKHSEENKHLSQLEKEQEKIKKKIFQLEKENLSKKPWQMGGEAGSTARPINSLLEEDLNFDHTTAAAPPITEETTKNLEDIIKQRIKDEAWDDVERKQKPVTEPFEYKKKLPLDQEKSKLSLSQIYEQEYIKQTEVKEGPQEEESEEHKEIKQLMSKLFAKLDALSNFHFTPKPLKPEIKIVTNTPVINMEEVAPIAVSDAMMLAPEETHEKKVELKGDTEKTVTDKKRDRRAKKLKQRMKAKDKEKKAKLVNKLKPGLGNKYAKKKALESIEKESKTSRSVSVIKEDYGEKALKSSSAFFSRLHDEVKQQVTSKKDSKEKRKKKTNTSQLKL